MSTRKIAVSVNPEVGGTVFSPEQLAAIGSASSPDAPIEMTPFKQLYVTVEEKDAEEAEQRLKRAGLLVLPSGFYTKNLQACNFCKGPDEAGLALARKLDEAVAGLEVPAPIKIGYAGCPLGTSEPLSKDVSVVKMRDTYDIYLGGDAKGIKPVWAQLFMAGVPEDRVIGIVLGIIETYRKLAKGKEKFRKFIDRVNMDTLRPSGMP